MIEHNSTECRIFRTKSRILGFRGQGSGRCQYPISNSPQPIAHQAPIAYRLLLLRQIVVNAGLFDQTNFEIHFGNFTVQWLGLRMRFNGGFPLFNRGGGIIAHGIHIAQTLTVELPLFIEIQAQIFATLACPVFAHVISPPT